MSTYTVVKAPVQVKELDPSGDRPKRNFCRCGCGTEIPFTRKHGNKPMRWAKGHNAFKSREPEYDERDCGYATSCWVARLAPNSNGYVVVCRDQRKRLLHRVIYERDNGPIPHGYTIDHLCCVTNCINPAHLEAVTHKENCERTYSGGRKKSRAA